MQIIMKIFRKITEKRAGACIYKKKVLILHANLIVKPNTHEKVL